MFPFLSSFVINLLPFSLRMPFSIRLRYCRSLGSQIGRAGAIGDAIVSGLERPGR